MAKKTKGLWGIVLAVAIIFSIAGVAGTWYYMEGLGYSEGYAAGVAYQRAIDVAVPPASLTVTLSTTGFNHAGTVASAGSVATETHKYLNITIENTDDERTAYDVQVLLYNPVTDKEGLNDNLETDNTEFTITSGGGTTSLFDNGDYIAGGFNVGDIPPGGSWLFNVTLTLEVAAAGTFQDAQSYTCYIYVYQSDADYSDVASYTVTT